MITLSQAGTGQARVAIENRRAANEYEVEFLTVVQARERLRVLRSSHIVMPEHGRAEFAVAAQGTALSVDSPNQKLRYDLELQHVTRQQTESLARRGINHEAGTQQTVRPKRLVPAEHSTGARRASFEPNSSCCGSTVVYRAMMASRDASLRHIPPNYVVEHFSHSSKAG